MSEDASDTGEPFIRRPRPLATRIAAATVAAALAIGTVAIAIAAAISLRKDHPEKPPANVATLTIGGRTVSQLGEGSTAIIMLHGASTHRDAFFPFMPQLAAAGFATYTLDYPSAHIPRAEVLAVKQYAFDHGATKFVLMGSSLGAGYALQLADLQPNATISISAVRDYPNPGLVMAIASKNDGQTAKVAARAADGGAAGSRLLIVSGQTHGADIVHPHPDILPKIVAFLRVSETTA